MDVLPLPTGVSNSAFNSKRRRFAPSSYTFTPYCDDSAIDNRDFDSPLLFQFKGQTPTQSDIEAELFRVGMRIRKSVNDGYKTTAFTPRPLFDMNSLSQYTQAVLYSSNANKQPLPATTFSGTNPATPTHVKSTPYEESTMWRHTYNHKRGHEDESDNDDVAFMPRTPTLGYFEESTTIPVDYFSIDYDGMGDISPFTVPDENQPPQWSRRRIAVPKSRKGQCGDTQQQQRLDDVFARVHTPFQLNGTRWMGHKRVTSCGQHTDVSTFDFGEAQFLQRREDIEMDCS